ncbi:putative signal transducing protein [Humisphaera borealis]|uniref:DUF2007 domain-containing protein n=1 Tax=Humisphaera borealis TaxID=2807512 RepID=A0A7M2WY98_9BACT|nr:DUF2007 domain-containing protein [Humisphaera borealis]QOV89801.1 DUF2007 domain-containing protein [Humisphaera borealis]
MRHIYTARDAMDANFLRGLLEQQGINAVVQGEALQETWGNLNLSAESLPSVWVDEADLPRAMSVVDEYKKVDAANADRDDDEAVVDPPTTATGSWTCGNCGRSNEPQFDRCWHCTHARTWGPALA